MINEYSARYMNKMEKDKLEEKVTKLFFWFLKFALIVVVITLALIILMNNVLEGVTINIC